MYETTITKKGQTTIPQEIRDRLGLELGGSAVWFVEGHRAFIESKNVIKNPIEELRKLNIKTKKSALRLKKEAEEEFW